VNAREVMTDAIFKRRAFGNGWLAAPLAALCHLALDRAGLVVVSKRGLVDLVEGVADQQAMADDSWRARLAALLKEHAYTPNQVSWPPPSARASSKSAAKP
jgi:hypothetical protein